MTHPLSQMHTRTIRSFRATGVVFCAHHSISAYTPFTLVCTFYLRIVETLLHPDKSHYLREVFEAARRMPESIYGLDDDYAALAMASKNMGYCLFPEIALQNVPFNLMHTPSLPA
jgi:hypothetical protein